MTTATVSVHVRPTRVHRNFEELKQRVRSNANRAAYNYARAVVKEAKIRVPVRTGYLRANIEWVRESPGVFVIHVKGNTSTESDAFYGVYVEYGTRNMAAQPYFRPAIEICKVNWRAENRAIFR